MVQGFVGISTFLMKRFSSREVFIFLGGEAPNNIEDPQRIWGVGGVEALAFSGFLMKFIAPPPPPPPASQIPWNKLQLVTISIMPSGGVVGNQ